ncbi:unnamed protein product [Ceutorhynchus assimilis]|uniref:G-protein coupled receptors family 1 profile domain-containing protein n=1 Tax=Ceutorhynchus assimilis TaxID=467358 RepID=A0A9N9MJF7_9CUCU|nr:unnamed protein product [Ceutorhynchus assimilis]
MDNITDTTSITLESSRFWCQKVLVPIMVCVGITGNIITVMVLTRRRMRSSTNIYLSALAIADIIHLFFVFLLSFKHDKVIHERKYELYWRFYGLTHWLCDAASSTSVWLTVSFTIERYIAVCHPMKGKYFCTENRAKTVTVIVYILCILTTLSTSFEYQLTLNDTVVCDNNCQFENTTNQEGHYLPKNTRNVEAENNVFLNPNLSKALENILSNCTYNHPHIIYVYPQNNTAKSRSIPDYSDYSNNMTIVHNNETQTKSCCNTKLYIDVESTNLGKHYTYTTIMYWYTALIFGMVPLILIAVFNCFLIRQVYVSRCKRRIMTRTNTQTSQSDTPSNENRITLMLIAVVVMFLICQSPTASYLIYYNFNPALTQRQKNIESILGNIFNFLLTINASCNFLLYSIISKNFRSTFKQLFFNRKSPTDVIRLASLRSNSQRFNPFRHGITRNASEYRTPRNLETSSLQELPRSRSLIVRPSGNATD